MRKLWLFIVSLSCLPAVMAGSLVLDYDAGDPVVARAAERIRNSWDSVNPSYNLVLSLRVNSYYGAQQYSISPVYHSGAYEGWVGRSMVSGSALGLYYGSDYINEQMGKGAIPEYANRSPEWTRRYASDYTIWTSAQLLELADFNISGFAWQWRDDWSSFLPDSATGYWRVPTVGEALEVISDTIDTGLLDVMLVIHIYAGAQTRLDCGDDAMIDAFIDRLRPAADAGIRHIMIGADDETRRSQNRYVCGEPRETARFGVNNIGRAHGYMMKRVAETLWEEYPGLEISFVPPVYSLVDHYAADPVRTQYLNQFAEQAPDGVMVVWTGPRIVPNEPMTKSDHTAFANMVPGHQLIYWDNCEAVDNPWSYWNAVLYNGAAADHAGICMINAHAFGWSEGPSYIQSANEYLWFQREYNSGTRNFQDAFHQINLRRYLIGGADNIANMSNIAYDYYPMAPLRKTAAHQEYIDAANYIAGLFETWNMPYQRTRAWAAARQEEYNVFVPTAPLKQMSGPFIGSSGFTGTLLSQGVRVSLTRNGAGTGSIEGDLYMILDWNNLYIGFDGNRVNGVSPTSPTGSDPRLSQDLLSLQFADDNGNFMAFYVNTANERSASEGISNGDWESTLHLNGVRMNQLIRIPFSLFVAQGFERPTSGKTVYAAIWRSYDNWHNYSWSNLSFPGRLRF